MNENQKSPRKLIKYTCDFYSCTCNTFSFMEGRCEEVLSDKCTSHFLYDDRVFSKGIIKKDKFSLCAFGSVVVVLLVGPMLDISSVFTASSVFSFEVFKAAFIAGLPVNIVHMVATAITLLLFSQPMFEKLDRIKLKYGMK